MYEEDIFKCLLVHLVRTLTYKRLIEINKNNGMERMPKAFSI